MYPSMHRMLAVILLCASALLLPGRSATGQEYPSRPLKFITPIAPGGLTDTLTRVLG